MVDWLAGKRVKGTSSERTGFGVGGWVELGRATASGGEGDLTVSGLTSKRYYQILYFDAGVAGALARYMQFNGDTGSNYAWRYSVNGGADSTATSQAKWNAISNNDTTPQFFTGFIANYQTKEKLGIFHANGQSTAGAGTAPIRFEYVGKWANTSNAITSVKMENDGTYASGDELIVLGWDPADTHTNNFWTELASVSGGSATMDATITSKKYIWFQAFVDGNGSGTGYRPYLRVGNSSIDTGNNYAQRISDNGGADATYTSQNSLPLASGGDTTPTFVNGFIINNASNEKLMIVHSVNQSTAGAATAPIRSEYAYKWANTSNQIDKLQIFAGVGSDTATTAVSAFKVWGAD